MKYENQLSAGATQHKNAKSVKQCLDFCVSNKSCVAVDVNTGHEPTTCWPHFDMDKLREGNVFTQNGVDQYRLVERCDLKPAEVSSTGIHIHTCTVFKKG